MNKQFGKTNKKIRVGRRIAKHPLEDIRSKIKIWG